MTYTKTKLASAIHSMASDPDTIQGRLYGAYLAFHRLKEDDFPEEHQDKWKSISERINTAEEFDPKDGSVKATVFSLTDEDCSSIIDDMVKLHNLLD